ncbi:general substrate transporter [Cladochytrium replicatum]|nr:general substrate transporter [Cladochytrium replicatum]
MVAAFENTDQVNFFTLEYLHLYISIFVAFLNSAINGYDLSLINGLLGMKQFNETFVGPGADAKSWDAGTKALLFAMLQMGSMIGCLLSSWPMDYFGRRGGMIIGSCIVIIASLLSALTNSLSSFMVGRFVLGFGIVFVTTAAPVYVAEVSHPTFRGRAAAIYNTGWFVGSIPAAAIVYALRNMPGNEAWRIPVAFQAVFSGLVLVASFVIPESPRWLLAKGHRREAMAFLAKYHANNKLDAEIVQLQLREIEKSLEEEKQQESYRFVSFFKSRSSRHRALIILSVAFFSQFAGNWVPTYFQTQVTEYFGIVGEDKTLLLNVVTGGISFLASIIGASLVDKFGRRPFLLVGQMGYALWYLLIMIFLGIYYNGLSNSDEATGPLWAGITAFVLLELFTVNYSICWTPLNALYPVECLNYGARSKGMAMCQMLINIANILQSYVLSYGLKNFRWKFFAFYFLFNLLSVVVVWLLFPETKGRTLEQLDKIFEDPNPVKASLEVPKAAEIFEAYPVPMGVMGPRRRVEFELPIH